MIEFIKVNIYSIAAIILAIVILLFLYKRGNIDLVRKIILSLVVKAEKALGSGTGELKYAMVIENIYHRLPIILSMLITKKELDCMIENAVDYMKEYLRVKEGEADLLGYDNEYKYLNVFKIN